MSKSVERRKAIMAGESCLDIQSNKGLKVVRVPKAKNDNPFQDANELLSSFPRAEHERREPTEKEIKNRHKGWGHKAKTNKR